MRPLRLLQASIFLFIGFVALAMVPRAQAGWNTQESTAATNSSFTFSYTNGSSPQIYYIRYSPNDGTTWYEAFGAAGPTLAGTVTFSSPGTLQPPFGSANQLPLGVGKHLGDSKL